jgi:hypothetical protein
MRTRFIAGHWARGAKLRARFSALVTNIDGVHGSLYARTGSGSLHATNAAGVVTPPLQVLPCKNINVLDTRFCGHLI